jgi:hypothetical protein
MHDAKALDKRGFNFMTRFLTSYPAESLPISSPLLDLFKTLCSSQPEISTYGKVYPVVSTSPGPIRRDALIKDDLNASFLPNIPGIFALIEDLYALGNPQDGSDPVFPTKGRHLPVTSDATAPQTFAFHAFPLPDDRSVKETWYLVTSGLQYACEADTQLNESFVDRYPDFGFPALEADDNLSYLDNYFCMDTDLSWFSQVRDVAAMEAAFFVGSGTLADCSPTGIVANQICVEYIEPYSSVLNPAQIADPLARFPFSIQLNTTARRLPALAEAMAAYAQTHVRMYESHPYWYEFGTHNGLGPFWDIRPIESSPIDETSYLSFKDVVRSLLKPTG